MCSELAADGRACELDPFSPSLHDSPSSPQHRRHLPLPFRCLLSPSIPMLSSCRIRPLLPPLTHALTHTRTHVHTHAHARTHTHMHTHTLARTRTRTHAHTHARAHMHTHTHTPVAKAGSSPRAAGRPWAIVAAACSDVSEPVGHCRFRDGCAVLRAAAML